MLSGDRILEAHDCEDIRRLLESFVVASDEAFEFVSPESDEALERIIVIPILEIVQRAEDRKMGWPGVLRGTGA